MPFSVFFWVSAFHVMVFCCSGKSLEDCGSEDYVIVNGPIRRYFRGMKLFATIVKSLFKYKICFIEMSDTAK